MIRKELLQAGGWAALGGRARALALRERVAVAAVLLVTLGVWAFLSIAEEMAEGETAAVDRALLLMFRTPGAPETPLGGRWLREGMLDITALGSVTLLTLVVVLIVGLFASLRRWREAGLLLVAAMGGTAIGQALKAGFGRERPEEAWRLVDVINTSFPSGHAMMSAVVYLTLAALIARFAERRRVKWFAMTAGAVLTVMVGVSRVYLGVHWPSDVLAGWCVGAAWAMVCWLGVWAVERKWGRRALESKPASPSSASSTPG